MSVPRYGRGSAVWPSDHTGVSLRCCSWIVLGTTVADRGFSAGAAAANGWVSFGSPDRSTVWAGHSTIDGWPGPLPRTVPGAFAWPDSTRPRLPSTCVLRSTDQGYNVVSNVLGQRRPGCDNGL